jgi:hypothetical protein
MVRGVFAREADDAHHGQICDSDRCRERSATQRKAAKSVSAAVEELKPEAAYFTPQGGDRSGFFVVNMQDSSQIAATAERFFFGLNARVDMVPVMAPDDLQKALSGVPGIIDRYG